MGQGAERGGETDDPNLNNVENAGNGVGERERADLAWERNMRKL